jgi:hypothetical protein
VNFWEIPGGGVVVRALDFKSLCYVELSGIRHHTNLIWPEDGYQQTVTTTPGLLRLRPPSIPAVVFVLLGVLVPILLQKPLLNSDGDLARHLRHGRYMLEHGGLIRTDPFSFTRPGTQFVGFEYGSQVLYALAERAGGLPSVAILTGLVIALTYALLIRFLLQCGVDPVLAWLTVALAVVLGIEHWMARPHLFSFLAVVVLLRTLERRPPKPVLWGSALFLLWANLHGGFIYGWILIALYLIGSLGELVWSGDPVAWRQHARYYLTLLVSAILITVINPHGLDLHRHLAEFFHQPFILNNTAEFVSPNFHEPGAKVFLAILLLTFGLLALYTKRPTLPRFLVICTGAAFALISIRNIPLFGLTGLPLLALHLDQAWRRLPDPRGVRSRFGVTAGRTSTLPWALPVAVLLCGLGLMRGLLGSLQIIPDEFDRTVFPVAAVSKARKEHLEGRLFSDFAWGGYLIYAWPEQKVFIDGGTDFFGEDVFREYAKVKQLEPGWRDVVAERGISLMLLRRESTLAHELARDGRWSVWYCDSLAVILRRSPRPATVPSHEADSVEQALDGCASRPTGASALRTEPPATNDDLRSRAVENTSLVPVGSSKIGPDRAPHPE